MLFQKLNQTLDLMNSLHDEGHIIGFTLIGGLAVSAWSRARATTDVDMLVLVQSKELDYLVEKLREAGMNAELRRGGFDDPIPLLIRADSLDIIIATKKYEAETIENSIITQIAGREIPIAPPEYLIILKLKAGGAQDLLDVREILAANIVDKALMTDLATRYHVDKLLHEVSK